MNRGQFTNTKPTAEAVAIRVRGIVQGVGFRPTVWRLAHECGLRGRVLNDAAGVLIEVAGGPERLREFCARLRREAPPLSRIDALEVRPMEHMPAMSGFVIAESRAGETRTRVAPDAALCPACAEETSNPAARRFRYPFTNCTHCGPRFSIIEAMPYDRAQTTMRSFALCRDCNREYRNPADRRFHAQPVACPECGPKAWLEQLTPAGTGIGRTGAADDVEAAARLLLRGEIVAIKGLGGFHLACDATNPDAVMRLRSRKRRDAKPFALMARDLDVIARYCTLAPQEAELLRSPEAPIVLLEASGAERLPEAVAPGLRTLGFMLPYTPLHLLILKDIGRPLVMTSGNFSDEPQITSNDAAREQLGAIADYALFHDREIANRIDDSVVRFMSGRPRLLRHARGYAPGAIALPEGFENATDLTAMGAELKAAFCILKDGAAVLSQHQGDLEDAATFFDYWKSIQLYARLFDHTPRLIVADQHPDYLSTKLAQKIAAEKRLPLVTVQHHHAHVAACMFENGLPLNTPPVLGIALDGLGYGEDGTIWGSEFLLADYRGYQRVGAFQPVAMLGGAQAVREPWRNTYAHLMAAIGWERLAAEFRALDLVGFLAGKPRPTLDQMLQRGLNSPLASSCGRLFDAAAAALGFARERALFEGQGAMLLEAAVSAEALCEDTKEAAYPFAITRQGTGLPFIQPAPMWQALLHDLLRGTPVPFIAARFHKGLAHAIADMADLLLRVDRGGPKTTRIVLSGGCFQNKVLLELLESALHERGYDVLSHSRVPTNDGGIALGQAAIAAARALA